MDYGVTRPVHFPDEGIERLYYAGSTWRHGADPYRVPAAVGVAEMRGDGWAYLTPRRGAALPATVITVPISADGPARVELDADGEVTWEVMSEQGEVPSSAPRAGRFRLAVRLLTMDSRLYSFRFEAA